MKSESELSISLVINTKNEELSIANCLKSCLSLVDEIVVCDMQSTDRTTDIAKRLGARIVSIPDIGFVEPARNAAIQQARSNWILLMDADEVVTPTLKKTLYKIARTNSAEVVRIPRKNILFGKWLKNSVYWPDYQVRFFRKGTVTWFDDIHSQPQISAKAKIKNLPVKKENAIIHTYGRSVEAFAKKLFQQAQHENDFSLLPEFTPTLIYQEIVGQFHNRYYRKDGYKDGVTGLVAAKFYEYYRFLAFVFTWQKKGFPYLDKYALPHSWKSNDHTSTIQSAKIILRQQREIERLHNEINTITNSKLFEAYTIYVKLKNVIAKVARLLHPTSRI